MEKPFPNLKVSLPQDLSPHVHCLECLSATLAAMRSWCLYIP